MFFAVVLGVFGFIVLILALYLAGNWLLGHLGRPKPRLEELARGYNERLLNPRWKELEEYFNQAIPERIKHVYTQAEIINRRDLRVSNRIFWCIREAFRRPHRRLRRTVLLRVARGID